MSNNPQQVQAIFLSTVEKPTAERAAHLDLECGADTQLRRRVEALLRAHDAPGSFLDSSFPTIDATIDQPVQEQPGAQIGPYKLLQQIGEGGMGVVYMAEQKTPVRRRVALKIIKPGMDTQQVIARFEAERQALAMMDHPNIAKVLDAGATDSGRPYFVMELVNGLPVTSYCDQEHLSLSDRLKLFVPICQAVQHAHQKGIIHRDLKPSNILVALYDGRAVPKVIDFGVAKATNQTLTDKTMFTQFGQLIGTLEYMSPEQAERNELDVDTRSDIYSLGVVLYELLIGERPFDRRRLRSEAFDEMLRAIREEDASAPSLKVGSSPSLPSVAANRRIEPGRLSGAIRGELDWIVMRCLEKERSRRYETANGLSRDIQRFLADEPVVAGPPSASYRVRKFIRRNRAPVIGAATVTCLLVLGLISMSVLFRWALVEKRRAIDAFANANEARRAEAEARGAERTQRDLALTRASEAEESREKAISAQRDAEAVSAFLVDLLSSVQSNYQSGFLADVDTVIKQAIVSENADDPNFARVVLTEGRDTKVADLLDKAAATVPVKFADQPEIRIRLHQVLMRSYRAVGRGEQSNEQQLAVLALSEELYGSESMRTNQERLIAGVLIKGPRGIELTRRAYEVAQQRSPRDIKEQMHSAHLYADVLLTYEGVDDSANHAMALSIARQELEKWSVTAGPVGSLSGPFESEGRSLAASVVSALEKMNRHKECFQTAVDYLGFAEHDHRKIWNPTWFPRKIIYETLAMARIDDAERLLRLSVRAAEDASQEDSHWRVHPSLRDLALLLRRLRKSEEAIALNERLIRAANDSRHFDDVQGKTLVGQAKYEMALAYADMGRTELAERAFSESLEAMTDAKGSQSDEAAEIWRHWIEWKRFGTPEDWKEVSLRQQFAGGVNYELQYPPIGEQDEYDFSRMVLTVDRYDPAHDTMSMRHIGSDECRNARLPKANGIYQLSLGIPSKETADEQYELKKWVLAANWNLSFHRVEKDPIRYPDEWQSAVSNPAKHASRRLLAVRRLPFEIPEIRGWWDFVLVAETLVTLPAGDYLPEFYAQNEYRFLVNGEAVKFGEVISTDGSPLSLRCELPENGRLFYFDMHLIPLHEASPVERLRVAIQEGQTRKQAARDRQDWGSAANELRELIRLGQSEETYDRLQVTHFMNELAEILGDHLGNQQASLDVLLQAGAIRASLFDDPEHPERIWQQGAIDQRQLWNGNETQINERYRRAKREGNLWRIDNANTALTYALWLRKQNQNQRATAIEREVIKALKSVSDQGVEDVSKRSHQIAQHFVTHKILPTGIEICELACRVAAKRFGEESIEYTHRLNALGTLHRDTDKPTEALKVFDQARSIRASLLGERHEQVAWVDRLIAETLESMGKTGESLDLRRQVLDAFRVGPGHDDANTYLVFDELVEACVRARKAKQAVSLVEEELQRLDRFGKGIGPRLSARRMDLRQRLDTLESSESPPKP